MDGIGILAKAPGDRLERRQLRGLRRLQPGLQRWPIALGKEGLKAPLELVPLGQSGIGPQERLQGSRSASVKRPVDCRISRESWAVVSAGGLPSWRVRQGRTTTRTMPSEPR